MKRIWAIVVAGLIIGTCLFGRCQAQPLAPAVTPQHITPKLDTYHWPNIPSEQDGLEFYCDNCQQTNPCAGGGSGAHARGIAGVLDCGGGGSSFSVSGGAAQTHKFL